MWQKVAKFKGAEYFRKALYEMSNVGYVNIIQVAFFKVTSDTIIKLI